jgi:hypothetical protein
MDNSNNSRRSSSGNDIDMDVEELNFDMEAFSLSNATTQPDDDLNLDMEGVSTDSDTIRPGDDLDLDLAGWSLSDLSPFSSHVQQLASALSLGLDDIETRQSTAAQIPEGSELDMANAMVLTLPGAQTTSIFVPRVMHWKPSPTENSKWSELSPSVLGTVLGDLSDLMSSGQASFQDLPGYLDAHVDDRLVQDDAAISTWTDSPYYNGQGTNIVVNNQFQVYLVPSLTSDEQQVVADNVSGLPLVVTDYDVSQIAQWHRAT